MSGIYIPNMELPKACFWRDKNGCLRTCFLASICSESPYAQGNYNIKPNSCPLKEVPTHGVLWDRDFIIENGLSLREAPTVIEASKEREC